MKLGIYKHYKGKYYEVTGLAIHTETNEKLVIYKCLYDIENIKKEFEEKYKIDTVNFVRPYDMFFEDVNLNGKLVPRFLYTGKSD